ncbi:Kinase, NEK [Giardia lamblia P15]|uniref:non-specific serine/threonine protein kinase n=1 Tax=Giardia intestinalis (strain P15) TaxID=658858 RepID=E1F187_GIAIA|nr:Kinase, NEK [Giardia lamblia P15]
MTVDTIGGRVKRKCLVACDFFEKVYAATDGQKRDFLVREVDFSSMPKSGAQRISAAYSLLSRLSSPGLVGCTIVKATPSLLVAELDITGATTLASYIRHKTVLGDRLSEEQILRITYQIAAVLSFLSSGLISIDNVPIRLACLSLSPQTIYIHDGSTIMLSDFSSSSTHGSRISGPLPSERCYLSPEVWINRISSPCADMWSLGCIVYELCTGVPPPLFCAESAGLNAAIKQYTASILADISKTPYSKGIRTLVEGLLSPASARLSADAVMEHEAMRAIHQSKEYAHLSHRNPLHLANFGALASVYSSPVPVLLCMQQTTAPTNLVASSQKITVKVSAPSSRAPSELLLPKKTRHAAKSVPPRDSPVKSSQALSNWGYGKALSDLMQAAKRGDCDAARAHLQDIRRTSATGATALMIAAFKGHLPIVTLLLNHERGMRDAKGRNALQYAVRAGQPECAKALLEAEFDELDAGVLHAAAQASGAPAVVALVQAACRRE